MILSKTYPLIGGPQDGKVTRPPVRLFTKPGELEAMLFGDDMYAFTNINDVWGWHYAGKVKFTPEEAARRAAGTNRGDA